MPRGGARPGAGRPRKNPAAPVKAPAKGKAKAKPAAKKAQGRGYTLANGEKSPDAPEGWPFGTKPPEEFPAPAAQPDLSNATPLEFLLAVMRNPDESKSARMQAASLAAQYMHARPTPVAKKEGQQDAAKKASGGRFKAAPAPLKLIKR